MKTDKTNRPTDPSDNKPNTDVIETGATVAEAMDTATAASEETAASIVTEPETAEAQSAGEESAAEKVPAHEEDEKRLTPVKPELVQEKPAPTLGDKRGEATIAAIAAAMDIDVRIAHALVDIHAGVDSAEAFARAYGVDNPERERKDQVANQHTTETSRAHRSDSESCDGSLPDDAKSIPTFLCNPRRGFWD